METIIFTLFSRVHQFIWTPSDDSNNTKIVYSKIIKEIRKKNEKNGFISKAIKFDVKIEIKNCPFHPWIKRTVFEKVKKKIMEIFS